MVYGVVYSGNPTIFDREVFNLLFKVKNTFSNKIYEVYAVTNKGSEYDKFLIYNQEDKKFEWGFISHYELVE